MKFELKPMSFGEVLDGAFKVFRSNLGLFLSIEALFSLPTILVSRWLAQAQAADRARTLAAGLRRSRCWSCSRSPSLALGRDERRRGADRDR